jgi:hypothetical protein
MEIGIHCRVQNSPPLVPVLSQINPLQIPNIFQIVIPSSPRSSKLFLLPRVPYQNPVGATHLCHNCTSFNYNL